MLFLVAAVVIGIVSRFGEEETVNTIVSGAADFLGAALTVTLRRGGLLLPVLILPLTVPVLIFGVAASNAAVIGPVPFGTPFTILCALTLMSLVIGPFAAAAALRAGQE